MSSAGSRNGIRTVLTLAVCAAASAPVAGAPWRSTLVPADWAPPSVETFYEDKLIQDFSYAGYRRGEEPIPQAAGPVFDVVSFGADPSGASDSTAAIQAAIQAAESAGGGVVSMPAGTFSVSTGSSSEALRVRGSGVVLRGAGSGNTRIVNTTTAMRNKAIIRFRPANTTQNAPINLSQDLAAPTTRIPVANPFVFTKGDHVRLEWDFTDRWIAEHGQQQWWNATDGRPVAASYDREVTAVNVGQGWIEVDIPTRYAMMTADGARVTRLDGRMFESGIEGISIGNVQHPGSGFGESDYEVQGTAAYDTHQSWAIDFRDVRDGWISDVNSFQPEGNTTTAHLLSNGIRLIRSSRITVSDVEMARPQYGGGGGNGYMYRLQHAGDNLLDGVVADFSRHGIVMSHSGTTGNVIRRSEDRTTNRATGDTGGYATSGGDGSDNHMHFSHSNLFEDNHAHDSFFEAVHRGSVLNHGLTAAHSIYWNISGSGDAYPDKLIDTEQARYGYVIGTSGEVDAVIVRDPASRNTGPEDHVEGEGIGDMLFPQSLYEAQLRRRLGTGITVTTFDSSEPGSTLSMDVLLDADGSPTANRPDVDVSGRIGYAAAAGATVGVTFDAAKDISLDSLTLGDKLIDGNIDRDSSGRMGVSGDPNGGGISADAITNEAIHVVLDTTDGLNPDAAVTIDTINISWLGPSESLTVVNLLTRESMEVVGGNETFPHFDLDVSDLDLSLRGGEAAPVAAVFAAEGTGFRVRGVHLSAGDAPPIPGDFDGDGDVDLDDFTLLSGGFGTQTQASVADGDADGDGDVDGFDVLSWQRQLSAADVATSASVPEPMSLLSLIAGLVGPLGLRRSSQTHAIDL